MKYAFLLSFFLFCPQFLKAENGCFLIKGNVSQSGSNFLVIKTHQESLKINFDEALPGGGYPLGITLSLKAWGDSKSLKSKAISIDISRRYLASSAGSLEFLKNVGETQCLSKK